MPHVDELLGITTLASMGLLVAVSLQPVDGATAAAKERPAASAMERPAAAVMERPAAAAAATAIARPIAATAAVRAGG